MTAFHVPKATSGHLPVELGDEPRAPADLSGGDTERITAFCEVAGAASRFVALAHCEAPEHQHADVQITVPFFSPGTFTARWQTAAGASRHRIVRAGECCVVASGQPHRFHWQERAEMVSLYLDGAWLERAADEARGRGGWHLPADFGCQDPVLGQLGAALRDAYRQPGGPPRLLVEGMAAVAAARLLRRKTTNRALSTRRPERLTPQALRRALDYIHAHMDGNIGLVGIAAAARCSPFHFARAFRAATGLPPHRYVVRERVERAKRRLRQGDDPVGQICVECGFADQSHFARLFRRLTGVTPRRYRREATTP